MRDVDRKMLESLAEEDEPLPFLNLVNGCCPWPAVELFDAFLELREALLIEASQAGGVECYEITAAGRQALDAAGSSWIGGRA